MTSEGRVSLRLADVKRYGVLFMLLFMTNRSRKLHMRFRLTRRWMTLDDFRLYKFEFSENFSGFRRFRTQQQLKMKIDQYCRQQRCKHLELEQFRYAFASRGFVSNSWAFLFFLVMSAAAVCRLHNKRRYTKIYISSFCIRCSKVLKI